MKPEPAAMSGFWRARPVLITGISGLLGGALARELAAAGARVTGLTRRPEYAAQGLEAAGLERDQAALVDGSIDDAEALRQLFDRCGTQVIFHLAGQPSVRQAKAEPLATFESNIGGTGNVLEAARRAAAQPAVILASTESVYGPPGEHPHEEDSPLLADTPYAVSKICAEALGRAYARSYGLPVAVLRCSHVYGPGERHAERLIPSLIRAALEQRPPAWESPAGQALDFLYVQDAVRAFAAAAAWIHGKTGVWEAFNVCSGQAILPQELAGRIGALASGRKPPEAADPSGRALVSAERARRVLGWEPRVALADGLASTVERFAEAPHA